MWRSAGSGGSTADPVKDLVGFINPGSLADRLPNKSSAQTDNVQLMGRPKYLNDRPEGRSNHRPEGLAEEERRPFLTPAHLSDRSARFGLQPASGWPLRPEGLAKSTASNSDPALSERGYAQPLLTALLRLT